MLLLRILEPIKFLVFLEVVPELSPYLFDPTNEYFFGLDFLFKLSVSFVMHMFEVLRFEEITRCCPGLDETEWLLLFDWLFMWLDLDCPLE